MLVDLPNGRKKPPTLDSRIASALSGNGEVDRDTLIELVGEAADEIDKLRASIEAEQARVLDLTNPDPDKSIATVASNQLKSERLSSALPRIQARIDRLDLEAQQTAWSEQANVLRGEADDLYRELQEVYPAIVEQLDDLFMRARSNAGAFYALLERAPPGVDRTFHPAEFFENCWLMVALPDWSNPRIVHPPRTIPPDPMAEIALASAAFAKQLDLKQSLTSGPDWHAAKQLESEQRAAEAAAHEAEQRQKSIADREAYHRELLAAERRRATGG